MSDLTRDVILRISAKNLSTADFRQATAAVNELTSAVDRQVAAAARGIVKEKELNESLAKLGDVSKSLQGFAALIQNLKGLDTQIAAQITKLAEAKAAWEAQKTINEQAANVTVRMTNRLAGLEKGYKAAEAALNGQLQRQTEYTAKLQQNGFDVQNLANAERQLTTVADQAGVVVNKLTQARDNYGKILRLNNEAEKEAARIAKEAEAAETARVAAIQRVTDALERQRIAEQAARLAAVQAGAKEYIDRINAQRKAEADFRASQAKGIEELRAQRMDAVRREVEANNRAREAEIIKDKQIAEDRRKANAEVTAGARGVTDAASKARMDVLREEIELNNRLRQERVITDRNAERNSRSYVTRLREEIQIQRQSARESIDNLKARIEGYRNVRQVIGETETAEAAATRTRGRGGQTGRPNLLGLQPYEMTNLGYQGVDVVQGFLSGVSPGIIAAQQGPQIFQIFGTAALKWAPIIVSALAAITVSVGAFQRTFREAASTREFSALLTDNANAANYTVGRLNDLRKAARDMGMSWTDAGAAITTAMDNNVAENRLKQLLQAAQDVKDLTGKDVPAAMKEFTTALTGSADELLKLNDTYHFLSPLEQQHVRDQYAAGEANKARAETIDKLSKTLRDRAEVGLSPWTKATRELSIAWDNLLISLSKTSAFQTLNEWLTTTIGNLGEFGTKLDELIQKKGIGKTLFDSLVGPDSVVGRTLDAIREKLGLPGLKWNPEQFPDRKQNFTPGGEGPGTSGVVVPAPITPQQQSANQKQVSEWLGAKGYSATAIAGIMGNVSVESSFNPANVNPTGHFGLFQWDKTRQAALGNPPSTDIAKQMELMDRELAKLDPAFKKATGSAAEMAVRFEKAFEISGGQLNEKRIADAQKFAAVGTAAAGTAAPTGPPTTGPTPEQVREGQKLVEQERDRERISRATSIEAEKQAKFAQIKREVEKETQDPAAQAQLIRIRQFEVEKALDREARDLRAKEDKEKIDDARHYNEIRAAGDTAVAAAQAQNITDWRSLQRIRDTAQGQERDRIARIDAENDRYQQAVKIVADLKRGLDGTYSTNLENRIAAINLKYKEQEEALKKLRDASPLGDKARFDTQIAALPALRTREIGQATGKALEAQADAAVAARNDLVNSANKLREAGAISISEQQQKVKDAYALTTPEIEKATAALEEWIKTAKEFGATDLDIEKVKAKIAELRVEAKYVDPFMKGLAKTVEESFTNRASQAFDTAAEAIGGLIAKTKEWKDVWSSLRSAAANFFAGILKDIATYIIKAQLAKLASSFMPGLGDAFGTAASSAATAAASGTASATGAVGASSGGFLSSLFGSGGTAAAAAIVHAGGVVGLTQLSRREVPGSWFDRAPRYHTGAVVGLAANEQAAILQRGEEVLSANNPRHARNWSGGGGSPDINIRNVLVADPDMVPQHMASSRGEKIIMSTLTRNAATVRQLVR